MITTPPVIPDRYKSDHLFLLVGTNPLPNFVAATLMLKPQGKLYLVHSIKTQKVAERLARYWIKNHQQLQFVPVDESDGDNIRQQIDHALTQIGDGHVGLNYTGGTKMMAVHASQTLRDHQASRRRPVTLSYLDARSTKMYIEHGDDKAFMTEPLLFEVQPSIQDIVELHAFELQGKIAVESQLLELATVLAGAHQSSEAIEQWRRWCDEVLREKTRTRNDREWDKENLLRDVSIPLPADPSLRDVTSQMQTTFGVQDRILLGEAAQQSGFAKVKHLCEWLDGKWLEHYVFHVISQVKNQRPESRIRDIGMGIRPKNEPDSPEYDIDIGVMQGYRLYAISCTTDADPGMCKLKLFEAYIRARNMAGDEACVGLVCMADKPENLQRQVVRSWDAEGKVRVFGRQDLPNLIDRMAEWFIST